MSDDAKTHDKHDPDDVPEILTEGDLHDVLQGAAVETPEGEDPIITEIFISGDDDEPTVRSSADIVHEVLTRGMRCFDSDAIHKESKNTGLLDVAKSVEGSTQGTNEIGAADLSLEAGNKVVEPPYPPELLSAFLEVDDVHFRCVKTKTTDAVGRDYMIDPLVTVEPDKGDETGKARPADPPEPSSKSQPQKMVKQSAVDAEVQKIRTFVNGCNEIVGFEGTLERAAMDYESIGWAAIEVIRSKDMRVAKIAHIPASRVRVLRGWKGFVEILGPEKFRYYQNFGEKVLSKKGKSSVDPTKAAPYNPEVDGEIQPSGLDWNFVDRDTGKAGAGFENAANEIVWIPKHHVGTIYYGFTDVIPALGALLANVHIRDYMLQFFEHNTIPRYAIIVEGAKLGEKVVEAITKYFSTHIKGKAHKTLIIPVPAMRGEVRVRFEKLASDQQEGSFQDTRKNNGQSILTAHGVSPAIIGINDTASLGSGKGLSQAEIYKDRIITPSQRYWAQKVNRLFHLGLGVQLVALKFNPLDIRDREAEMKILTGYQEKGVLNINQVIEKAGLGKPVPGGDRNFIITPQGVVFVDELTEAAGAELEAAEEEIQSLKDEMTMRAVIDKEKQKVQAQAGNSKPNGSSKPSGNGAPAKKPAPATAGSK